MFNVFSVSLLAQAQQRQGSSIPNEWLITIAVGGLLLVGLLVFNYMTRAGIIARATTKEALRQPVYLLLLVIALLILVINTFLPFFSFGDDVKMLKDCGLATILVSSMLLAIWTSSTSISEEIEGKTAMTLLSKPINRRHFVVGKYVGILQTVLWLMIPLSLSFLALIFYKIGYDAREAAQEIPSFAQRIPALAQIAPAIILIFMEAAVMTSISVAISTRLPMIVNMVTCFTIFVVGHLTPVLVQQNAESKALEMVQFMAQLIATVLPSLESFNSQTAVAVNIMIPPVYLAWCAAYCAVYCTAALLLAFILFEDRDLA